MISLEPQWDLQPLCGTSLKFEQRKIEVRKIPVQIKTWEKKRKQSETYFPQVPYFSNFVERWNESKGADRCTCAGSLMETGPFSVKGQQGDLIKDELLRLFQVEDELNYLSFWKIPYWSVGAGRSLQHSRRPWSFCRKLLYHRNPST